MKSITGSNLFAHILLNSIKTDCQRAWYGVARDLVMDNDDLTRQDSLEDERKGYKYDEVADIRSLLDQFMTTTAADKALSCFKGSTSKTDDWNRIEVPDNNDILMFFRTRTQDAPAPPPEVVQEETSTLETAAKPQDQAVDRFAQAKQSGSKPVSSRHSNQAAQQAATQAQGKRIADSIHQDPQSQGDFRAQITGKIGKKTLLQELAAKTRKQEAASQNLNNTPQSRFPRQRKYYDSADYP